MSLDKNTLARLRRRWKRPQPAEAVLLVGGPLDGHTALLTRPFATLEMTHDGRRGRYNDAGAWEWLP